MLEERARKRHKVSKSGEAKRAGWQGPSYSPDNAGRACLQDEDAVVELVVSRADVVAKVVVEVEAVVDVVVHWQIGQPVSAMAGQRKRLHAHPGLPAGRGERDGIASRTTCQPACAALPPLTEVG